MFAETIPVLQNIPIVAKSFLEVQNRWTREFHKVRSWRYDFWPTVTNCRMGSQLKHFKNSNKSE
jgi:hypothetical protein